MNGVDEAAVRGFYDPKVVGFVGFNGPLFRKEQDGHVLSGFVIEPRHCNPAGFCHGGCLATLADVALAREAGHASGLGGGRLVTVSMTLDFLAGAREGEWLEASARIVRQTRTLVFVEGLAKTDARAALRMNAIFSIRQPIQHD
jgi:uncharacterized protein (TIGR00369 family)